MTRAKSGRLLQMSGVVVDMVYRISAVPEPGEEAEAGAFLLTAGGGYNAMIAARRFGIDVAYGGPLGTGIFSALAERMIGEAGITILAKGRAEIDQGTCVVLVDGQAERTFITHHGAERANTAEALADIDTSAFDWILLSGYSLFKERSARFLVPWVDGLRPGPVFIFDPGPIVAQIPGNVSQRILDRADWVSANRRESKCLVGTDDPERAANLLAKGRQGAIVRNGADGCWLATNGAPAIHIPGLAVEAIDSNGAGDCHIGTFVAAMCLGKGPGQAALLANAAAAISTTRHGPATSPGLEETQAFLAGRKMTSPGAMGPTPWSANRE